MRSLCVEKSENELLVRYTPSDYFDNVVDGINEGKYIKRTFWVSERNIKEINQDEGFVLFSVASLEGEYYCLDKETFDIQNMIYIDKTLCITDKWFVSYPHTSIISILDEILSNDMYIVEENDGCENHIPVRDYVNLIDVFPNSYEKDKYVRARIAYLLLNYVEGMWKYKESYEKYLDKKEISLALIHKEDIKLMGYHMYKMASETLKKMLDNPKPYSESVWQEKIYEIVCVLYPKYIARFREIVVGSDGRHAKKPDFLLIDSSGFVDILEIKKPNDIKVVTSTEYRNNYVAGRDLEGAIVQIEKYIYILNHEGEARVSKIQNQIAQGLPKGMSIKVVNPQGILLLGRSNELSKEQQYDFEIIKRQHKNIVDIMTYDDLLARFDNILTQMEANIQKSTKGDKNINV